MKKTQLIKDRLNDHLKMLEKLEAINMEIRYVYGTIKSPDFSGMPKGGAQRTSEEERLCQILDDKKEEAARKQAEIDRDWADLGEMIERLDPFEALVMNLRYRYGEEWDDVCRAIFGKRSDYELELDRYEDKMYKAHGRALCALADMLLEREQCTA